MTHTGHRLASRGIFRYPSGTPAIRIRSPKAVTMKQFLIRLVRIYFGLGAAFGGLGILSYVWGLATQANCGDFVLFVATMAYAVFGAVVRTFLWLPSLIHWWLGGPTFLQ
jgi:hypothetical protein